MTAGKDRAVAPARSLLFLSGLGGILLLVAVTVNLSPLLRFDGPVPAILAVAIAALLAAAGCGFAAAVLVARARFGRGVTLGASLTNAILIAAVALYFAGPFPIFDPFGPVLVLFAIPGFVSAAMVFRMGEPKPSGPFTRL